MKVRGMIGEKTIYMLLDVGSTHNFMDPQVTARLGCSIKPSTLTKVTVAD